MRERVGRELTKRAGRERVKRESFTQMYFTADAMHIILYLVCCRLLILSDTHVLQLLLWMSLCLFYSCMLMYCIIMLINNYIG